MARAVAVGAKLLRIDPSEMPQGGNSAKAELFHRVDPKCFLWFASLIFPHSEREKVMSESNLVRMLKWLNDFRLQMVQEMRRQGWSDEEISSFLTETEAGHQSMARIVASLKVVDEGSFNHNHETLMVNMFFSRTFAESVEAGEYKMVNGNINENNFPINGLAPKQLLLPVVNNGPYRTDGNFPDRADEILPDEITKIILVDMNGKGKPAEALEYMRKRKLRPMGTSHLLAIGEQHPDLQRQVKVLALESSCVFLRGRAVLGLDSALSLDGSDVERSLDIFWYDRECDENTRFGAIAEEVP